MLSWNVEKTVYITSENYSDSVPNNINIGFNEVKKLKKVEDCKYLGIIFDYNMIW